MVKKFYRKPISASTWTDELSTLFEDLQTCITSSPVLARFDPSKMIFLKTDWSSEGMGWILMQPTDNDDLVAAAIHLLKTGVCLFDLSLGSVRLKPVVFGSRGCNDNEKKFHSFIGEGAYGRWAIT